MVKTNQNKTKTKQTKKTPVNAGDIRDAGSVPGSGRSHAEGNGNPLQYSCLGDPWTEECGGLQSIVSHRAGTTEAT